MLLIENTIEILISSFTSYFTLSLSIPLIDTQRMARKIQSPAFDKTTIYIYTVFNSTITKFTQMVQKPMPKTTNNMSKVNLNLIRHI